MNDRRRHLILIGCILAALIGVAFLAVPSSPIHKKLTLGLDLQGGLEVVLKAEPPKGHKLTPEDLSRSIDIMRNRIDKLGVSEPEIRKQGSNQIVIQLAGIHNVNDAAALIGKTAVLEFYDFEADVTGPSVSGGLLNATPVASASMYDLLAAPATRLLANKGDPAQWYLFNDKHVVKAGPAPTRAKLLANEIVRKPTSLGRPRQPRAQGLEDPDGPERHGRRQLRGYELPDSGARQRTEGVLPPQAPRREGLPEQPDSRDDG